MTTPENALGKWMSAALDDPKVCDEMKADIRAWFDSLDKPALPSLDALRGEG